jgi:nicotinamide-nucleotide amidase
MNEQAASDVLTALATQVGAALTTRGQMLAVAESCTGGWVAKVLTDIPGSSAWLERGFVTYSNAAKQDMLGVSAQTLERHGAVSGPVVAEMARGALRHSRAQVALAVSGIAGPGGGSPEKPVGTVWLAWAAGEADPITRLMLLDGDRAAVRLQAVAAALHGLLDLLASHA